MASLDRHLRLSQAEHDRLSFRADCPYCQRRLLGRYPEARPLSRRGEATAAAGLAALSGLLPASAAVASNEQPGVPTPGAPPAVVEDNGGGNGRADQDDGILPPADNGAEPAPSALRETPRSDAPVVELPSEAPATGPPSTGGHGGASGGDNSAGGSDDAGGGSSGGLGGDPVDPGDSGGSGGAGDSGESGGSGSTGGSGNSGDRADGGSGVASPGERGRGDGGSDTRPDRDRPTDRGQDDGSSNRGADAGQPERLAPAQPNPSEPGALNADPPALPRGEDVPSGGSERSTDRGFSGERNSGSDSSPGSDGGSSGSSADTQLPSAPRGETAGEVTPSDDASAPSSGDSPSREAAPDQAPDDQEPSPEEPSADAETEQDGSAESGESRSDGDTHVVQDGESLWLIAEGQLGSDASDASVAAEVERLWDLNDKLIGTGDPDLIYPGQELRLG